MSTIVTRAGKGSPLTHTEVDNNFTNLNTDKLQSGDTAASLVITSADINGGAIDGTTIGASTASTGAFTTLSATEYRKAGVDGKLLVKSEYQSSGTNFSTAGFTNVVLSSNINYEPVSPDSEVWVTITAFISLDQTGGDNDVAATLYAYSFQSNGTTRISAVGLADSVTDNTVGFVDMTTNGEVRHCITIQGQCERASDGEVYVRLWGSLATDGTSGYAATMEMTVCDFVFKEYL
jgi:hypothetical protein